MCQERGFELLEALYSKADRLKTVQVLLITYTMHQLSCMYLILIQAYFHCRTPFTELV